MTAQSKATLKTYFETGDYPTELQFADLVDSFEDTGSIAAHNALATAHGLTADIKAALAAAVTPSATNPYLTRYLDIEAVDENAAISTSYGVFNGVNDGLLGVGINMTPSGRINTARPAVGFTFENDYYDTAAAALRHMSEWYITGVSADGLKSQRMVALTFDNTDQALYAAWDFKISPTAYGAFNVSAVDGSTLFTVGGATGNVAISGTNAQLQMTGANPVFQATHSAGLAIISNGKYIWCDPAKDGFLFGSGKDTNLYRSAANELKTDDSFFHAGTNLGFYGTTPVAKQTGVAVSAAGIHAALVSLGLIGA